MISISPILIAILAIAFSCSPAIAIPESEPNDDIASADLADIANSITGSIQSGGDTDFFEIEDFGACPMRISASAEITTGSDIGTTDFELKLWDANGNLLSDSTITSATQRTATVFQASPVLGPTFLSISRSSGAPFGSYQIDVQKNIVNPPRPKVRILTIKKRSAGRAKLRILASSGSARHYLDSVWVVAPGNSPASISLEPTSAGSNRSNSDLNSL